MTLRQQIEQEIRQCGPMPFSRYMEICLYDPVQGYYSRHAEQFGKAGDFYTSSDVHAVFGRLLARQFDEMWRALDRPAQIEILELGPGRGLFARDVLDWSRKKFPDFFASLRYTLQESSPALRAKLKENLQEHVAGGKAMVVGNQEGDAVETQLAASPVASVEIRPEGSWASHEELVSGDPQLTRSTNSRASTNTRAPQGRPNLAHRSSGGYRAKNDQVPEGRPIQTHRSYPPGTPIIVFANEFFDSLPIEIVSSRGKLHLEFENDRLDEIWLPASLEELGFLDRYSVHPEPCERLEVALAAHRWMNQIADAIQRGFLLIFDYGYTRDEQLAGRHRGTLMAYRRHSANSNAYEAPGEQDLTAHVNFTALTAAASLRGLHTHNLLTQSQFLMGIGQCDQFADAFEDCRLPQERAKVALQLKHLVTPAGMGETFHVLLASRAVAEETVTRLSGLSFAGGE
jgi:SAM-dependent MidA family methyltransferase